MNIWKRSLSMVLAVAMILCMVPMSVFAVDDGVYQIGDTYTTKTADAPNVDTVENAVWVQDEGTTLNPNPKTVCGNLYEHTHDDGCYTKSCDHANGHLSTCYSTATSYALCTHEDESEHAGTVTLADVVTFDGNTPSWKKDHPAYPAVYAVYKAAYDEAYANTSWYFKDSYDKAQALIALTGKTFCYTVETSAEPDLCTHTCSEVGGSCYTKTCLLTEHTHDTSENGCYEYRWTLKADANGNNIADDAEIYTVVYTDGVEGEEIFADQSTSELAYGAETPAAPSVPTREHYEFAGWSPEVAATVTAPAEGTTITYTATWTPVKYTITWNWESAEGKAETKSESVAYGSALTAPDAAKAANAQYTYTFLGWKDADGETYAADQLPAVSGDAAYTAVYTETANKYTVTWIVDGNKTTVDYAYGATITKPADPTKEGYNFGGWGATVPATMPAENLTFTAQWTVGKYNVTWNVDGAETTVSYDFGATISLPDAPTKEGYTFAGWDGYTNGMTMPAEDLTFTAKWTINSYDIGWDYDGDGIADDTTSVAYGETPAHADPTKEYYTFAGWTPAIVSVTGAATYTATWTVTNDVNGNNVPDKLETATVKVEITGNGTVTLTAADAKTIITNNGDGTYTVVYNSAAEDGNVINVAATPVDTGLTYSENYVLSVPASVTVENGKTAEVAVEFGTRTLAANNGTIYISGYDVTAVDDGLKDKVLTAAGLATSGDYTVTWNDIDLPLSQLQQAFYNWSIQSSIGSTMTFTITDNDTGLYKDVVMNVVDPRLVLDISATEESVTYSAAADPGKDALIAFIKDYISATATDPQTGNVTPLSSDDITVSFSYTWPEDGKTTEEPAEVTAYVTLLANATYSNAPTATLNLTLKDTTPLYTVKYVVDGKTVLEQVVAEGGATPTYGDPTKDNYSFVGWDAGDDGKADEIPATVTGNATYTAVWTDDIIYTVTFMLDENTQFGDVQRINVSKNPEAVVADPGTPDVENKIFAGWDTEIVGKTPTASVTVYAKWVDDVNNNNVLDANETIKVVIVGKGSVTVTGATKTENGYVYDSTGSKNISVVANPVTELKTELSADLSQIAKLVSSSYVSGITVDGVAAEITYSDVYTVTHSFTANGAQTVTVTFTDAGFDLNDERLLNYYDGMTGVKNEDIYNAIVKSPAFSANDAIEDEYTITYKARDKMTHSISVASLGLGDLITPLLTQFIGPNLEFEMPELWLDVNVEGNELNEKIANAVSLQDAVDAVIASGKLNALVNEFVEVYTANILSGNAAEIAYNAVKADLDAIYTEVYAAAMYYKAHPFGYNNTDAETVTEVIKVTYGCDAYYIQTESDITLKDLREASFVKGNNVSVVYKDYTDEELAAAIGAYLTDAEGNVIEGVSVTSKSITDPYTFEGKGVSETAYEITFKFAGNDQYRPSEATFTVTVTKADASIDVPNVTVTYGDQYSVAPEVTLGNKYGEASEITDSLIQIIVGLDAAELDVNGDGVTGLATRIQVILPADLQEKLDALLGLTGADTADGASMSLSELNEYLQYLGDGSVDALNEILTALNEITETNDIVITIGGNMPTDIGVYLYGAVSTNSNYKTTYDVGYIIIKPDAEKVYLDFNYKDTNGIFTWELLQYLTAEDLGASAYSDEALTSKNDAATALVKNLYFGIDDEGNLVYTLDASTLGNGAYTQIAFITDFGNEMVYAEPIVRAFVIVPNVLDIEIVDGDNNAKDLFTYEFDNTGKAHYVTLDGERIEAQINYVGIQTNTNTYKSTEAPKRAGAYIAYVTYLTYNDAGELTGAGFDVATIVIKPTESTINVDSKVVTVQPGVSYNLGDLVTVGSTVPGLKPDTTIISASVNTDGTYSEIGWDAVQGNVNVDFPAWVDALIAQYAPSVVDGITAAEFGEKLVGKLPQISEELEALGIDASVIDALNEAVNEVADILAEVPEDVTLSFKDDVTVSNVGAYLVVGVVTDSDHIPSVDAGILVITPDVTQVELKWNYEDANGIWTKKLLQYVDLYASAFDIETGKLDEDATAKITYKFISVDENGMAIYDSAENLPNGVYVEVAYIELELDGQMVISDMIARVIVLTPDAVNVNFHDGKQINNDRKYTYDGKQHDMGDVIVTELDGTVIDTSEGELTVTYIGVATNGERYNSTEAPVNAGVYTVIATYVEYDENGEVYRIGTGIGALAIEKAPLDLDLEDTIVTWDGNEHFVDVTNPNNGDYVTVIIDRDTNWGNIILEDDLEALWALVEEKLETEIPDTYDVAEVLAAINEILNAAEDVNALLPEEYQGYGAELLTALRDTLATLPQSGTITVNGAYPSEIGTYECYALAYSNNHKTEASRGYLKIVPIEVKVIVDNSTKFYGESDPTPSYTVKYYDHLGNELTGFDTDVVVDITREEGEDVGKYTYTATVTVDDEHYAVTAVTVDAYLEIIPAEVTITVDDASKFYGDEDPTNDPDVNVTSGKVTADELNVQISREEGENVGEYGYIVSYTESDNWNVTVEAGALTINPAEVTITVNDATKVYGESDPANDAVVNVTSGKVTDDELNVEVTRKEGKNVGEYDYIVSYTESDNWNVTVEAGALTITPAKVTITVNDASKVYGETDPANDAVVNVTSGKVTVDELNVEVTREEGKDAGEYDYIVNYTESDNWDVTVEAGKLTIDPAKITVTVSDASKIYGQEDPTIDYSVVVNSGVVSDEELELSVGREAGNDVGTYNYTVSYTDSKNWIVNTDGVGSLTITKATVTITIKDNEIEVNNTVPAVDYDIDCDGVVTDEELNLVITWNADTIGENVLPGVYDCDISYNDPTAPDNWDVIVVNEDATLTVTIGDYVCWNMQTGVYYDDLSDALEDVDDEATIETIQMLKDYTEKYVIIAPGTTLDLADQTVTATFVVGLEGSYLTGDIQKGSNGYAKLIVDPNNIELADKGYTNEKGQYILPIWDPNQECFIFSQFVVNTANSDRGLFIDEEEEVIYFQFKHQATGAINQSLLADGADDNELKIVVVIEWETENGIASQEFVYNNEQVSKVTGAYDYVLTLDYTDLELDLSTLKISGRIVTDSGATAYGQVWTYADAAEYQG